MLTAGPKGSITVLLVMETSFGIVVLGLETDLGTGPALVIEPCAELSPPGSWVVEPCPIAVPDMTKGLLCVVETRGGCANNGLGCVDGSLS